MSVNVITRKLQIKSLRNFMEALDIIQEPISQILYYLDLRSRSVEVKRSKSFL